MSTLPSQVSNGSVTQFWNLRALKKLKPFQLLVVLRREVPSEGVGKERGSPPSLVMPIQVKGTFLEVADHRTCLLQEVLPPWFGGAPNLWCCGCGTG